MTGGEGEEEGKTKDRSVPDGSNNNNTRVTRGDGTEGKGEGGEREEEGGEEIFLHTDGRTGQSKVVQEVLGDLKRRIKLKQQCCLGSKITNLVVKKNEISKI